MILSISDISRTKLLIFPFLGFYGACRLELVATTGFLLTADARVFNRLAANPVESLFHNLLDNSQQYSRQYLTIRMMLVSVEFSQG